MSKHTPGPWAVDGPPWNQIVWSSGENRVCFLAHSNGRDDERDIATGRLIAAAPLLLDALKGLLPILEAVRYTAGLSGTQIKRMEAAKAALAAATQATNGEPS